MINLVNEALVKAADYCGVKSGRDVDKFKECKLTAIGVEELSFAPPSRNRRCACAAAEGCPRARLPRHVLGENSWPPRCRRSF